MGIKRSFWAQVGMPLVYAGSSRTDTVIGSSSCMSYPVIVRREEADSQLVCSITETGAHAPVLDIDFGVKMVEYAGTTMVSLDCPTPAPEVFAQLGRSLVDCGFTTDDLVRETAIRSDAETTVIFFTVPVNLIASSTPGHFHLYVEHEITWRKYRKFLLALQAAGIIGKDFADMSLKCKASYVRRPGIDKKNEAKPDARP